MLTNTEVLKAKPRLEAYRMTDGRGLYLTITPTGGKLWRYKYRHEGREKLMSFGAYPDVTLLDAREKHAQARRVLASGVDPMAQRKVDRLQAAVGDVSSFQSVALLWLEHWRVDKDARHVDTTRRRLEANVYPALGSRPIADIEAPELVAMAKAIEARGVADIPKRALETTGQIFRYGVAHGYCKRNPAVEFKPSDILKPRNSKNMARVDAKELPALLKSIEVYRGTPITRLAIKLMALTFVRTAELIGATWDEFDLDVRGRMGEVDAKSLRWNIPAERMKMKTPHIVPLSTQALEVLELLRTISGGGKYLFPGERDARRHMSNNTILYALDGMGYKGRMTGHGFRGVASTLLHEQGWPHEHIELQLAHTARNSVSAAYNHALYLEPRAAMMQAWADYLERAQRGK